MRLRRIQVTGELLVEALDLPEKSVIVDMRYVPEFYSFEFKIEHPSFDDVPSGERIPMCKVYYQIEFHHCPVDKSAWKRYQASWGTQVWM